MQKVIKTAYVVAFSSQELLQLIKTVFSPQLNDKNIALIVDVPDVQEIFPAVKVILFPMKENFLNQADPPE